MAPKRNRSPPPQSNIQNVDLRSSYGDMYATRYAALMTAHVATLRFCGMIEEEMAVELLNPFTDRIYSSDYLATHPEYTGEQPEMSSIHTAERHRLKRDREMEQFVKDYRAGRIDERGNSTRREAIAELKQVYAHENHTGSEPSMASSSKQDNDSQSTEVSVAGSLLGTPEVPLPVLSEMQAPVAASLGFVRSTRPQRRKIRIKVDPLKAMPGTLDYSEFKYGELVAECRRRKILGSGCSQSVRNRLIQDDINVKQSLPRELASYKGRTRKEYKFGHLAEMRLNNVFENLAKVFI